jgi:23S rRNA (uracil1939-C5)-methyltransferase/tRNA (uracil-5-)-methyltransferase
VGKKSKYNDTPFAYHQEIELEITTLTNLGSGLGRVTLPDSQLSALSSQLTTQPPPAAGGGWVVMVPFTLPGERVRVRVFRNQKNFSEADLVEVLTPSPHRVAATCPLFARCGGCQYQHLAYAEQLLWKQRQVTELLRHMAGIEFAVSPVVPSPREFGYRSKITPHFNPPRDVAVPPPIGFLRQGTRFDIVDVPRCPIATDAINAKLPEVRARVHVRAATGDYTRASTLLLREASGQVTTDYEAIITESIDTGGSALLKLRFLARDFFQNNPFILPAFTGYVRAQAAASGARYLVDAYCGSGLFALTAAPSFTRVAGIELSESSIRFARENATANSLPNVTFQAGDAAQIFAGLPALATPADPGAFAPADTAVIIDPPRKGCDEAFLSQLFAYAPRAVVYVSCDPATQMRDLKSFLAAGYQLTAAQPFDLFPQTRHLECVLTLVKAPAAQ